MKYIYILFLAFFYSKAFSQDVIIKSNGKTINSKIIEMGIENIKYYKFSNQSGPIFLIKKKDVDKIIFEDGSVEYFELNEELDNATKEQLKDFITVLIDKYGFWRDSNTKRYRATFEDDRLRLTVFSENNFKINEGYTCDLSNEPLMIETYKRRKDYYLSLWTKVLKNKKKDEWSNFRLVMRIKGSENSKLLEEALRQYNKLLIEKL